MRKPSASYWAERFNLLEQNLHDQGAAYFNRVGRSYDAAIRDLEKELAGWYSRYATENGITYAEAKKQLSKGELAAFKMDVEEYIEKGRSLDPQWREQLEKASVRVHVSRLEAMKIRMQQNAELLAGETRDALDDMAHKVYSEKYYHTLYEIQKGVGVGFDCAELSDKKIKAAIGKTWAADGKHFSDRIWEDKARLVNELDTTFTQGVIRGTAPKKVIAEISKRMSVKKSNVARLILTENKALQSRAELDGYKELGVNVYEIVATLDTRTSPVCREMDGKQFKRSEFEPGITAPPFHPYCRTCTVPYDEDVAAIFGEGEQRAARDKEGKYYRIPAKIKYGEWYEAFINGGDKTAFPLVSAVEAVKALQSVYDCKTVEEVETLLKSQEWFYKTTINGKEYDSNLLSSLNGVELEAAKEIYIAYDEIFKKYPQLIGKLSGLTTLPLSPRTYAQCSMGLGSGGINLNTKYYNNLENFKKVYLKDLEHGFHPKGTDWRGVLTHEVGHAIDDYLSNTLKLAGSGKYVSAMLRPKVMRSCGFRVNDAAKEVSVYATKNAHEWFAECFAEWMKSENPRKVATEFGKQLEELLKEVK